MADSFKILENLVNVSKKRHEVLVSNIANVDTPNYKAKDIKFENVLAGESLSLKKTKSNHIDLGAGNSGNVQIIDSDNPTWKDGNNVELDQEVAKMTENAMLYQAGTTLISTKIKMFKAALRRS